MKVYIFLTITMFSSAFLNAETTRFKTDGYSTHQPVIYAAAQATDGPIIEFGTGFGSTDLLHELCAKEGRILISLDDNKEWLDVFKDKYRGNGYEDDNSGWHKIYYVPGMVDRSSEDSTHWVNFIENCDIFKEIPFFSLCFIDQAPFYARYETIKRMKNKSLYVVVHDIDYFAREGVFGVEIKRLRRDCPGVYDFSDTFSNYEVYFPNSPWCCQSGPPTLLASEFEKTLPKVDYSKDIVLD